MLLDNRHWGRPFYDHRDGSTNPIDPPSPRYDPGLKYSLGLCKISALMKSLKLRRMGIQVYQDFKVDIKVDGLYYKLLSEYNINDKYVRILQDMYSDLKGCVNINGNYSQEFKTSQGLRQGCNLSPHLFNMYINDLIAQLSQSNTHPVGLNNLQISSLCYADDMLLLSHTESGLQKPFRCPGSLL